MRVRLTQLDGALPNLALMRLSHWHKARGDDVVFSRDPDRSLFEPTYGRVYGSALFDTSAARLARFLAAFPDAVVGGTGTPGGEAEDAITVEQVIGCSSYEHLDYSIYPAFKASIGYTQRGCRFKCKFCCVWRKEGRPLSVNTIADLWRGKGHPKSVHLLDSDFFGQPQADWEARIRELRSGKFRVCFNQGVNIRVISDAQAAALATVEYRDDAFRERRLYTAWDQVGDERVFFRGIDRLEAHGIPPRHVMAYMLVGFAPGEPFEDVMYRFRRMVDRGVLLYPMVFNCRSDDPERHRQLKRFQRWAITGLYRAVPWEAYDPGRKSRRKPRSRPAEQLELRMVA